MPSGHLAHEPEHRLGERLRPVEVRREVRQLWGDGQLLLSPFRTLGNDAEGRVYARDRGLEFPFPNDYFDAPAAPAYSFHLDPETACTGIILVGYREPLGDHVVECADLLEVAGQRSIPVAVWRDGGSVVQVSELYRP